MKNIFGILFLFQMGFGVWVFAEETEKATVEKPAPEKPGQPRQKKAHVHGSAKLGIAFEGQNGKIDFEAPADSVIGFEHRPKSAKDKKTESEQLEKLEKNISDIIVFDSSLSCKINMESSEIHRTGPHADLEAGYIVRCGKSPKDSVVKFHFQKIFPRLKKVEIQALVSDLQLSTTVTKDDTSLELKNP